ncbi:MAG: superfamily protein-like exporter [Solirubrobacterales bacterium]|nr:superfamily protein-like exporter [Solirubrobacterales bacterium]
MRRLADICTQLAYGAVCSPRRTLLFGLVAVVVAVLAALQLKPASPQSLLARSGSDVGAATIAQERAFGGEPVVVVLEGDVLDATLKPDNLAKLLTLERRLGKLSGVRTVIGPATFVDRSVQQMFGVVQQELGPAAERADKAARAAAGRAQKSGKFTATEVQAISDEARLRALGPLREQYQELFVRFGTIGLPSVTNRTFVAELVLGASPVPKKRFAWLFPDRTHSLIVLRTTAGLPDAAVTRIGHQARTLVGRTRLPGVRTSVAGAPLVVAQATATVADELRRLVPVVLVAMAIALLLGLGRRNRALHLLLPAGAAVALTAGLSWPLGLGFTAATLAALPVVLGLAIDYVVQLQARYWTEREGGSPPTEAARAAVRRVGPTLLLAGCAMAAGFLALLLSPVPLVGRLGVTLAVGVGCSLVCLFALAAPLMVAFDRPGRPVPHLRLPRPALSARARFALLAGVIGITMAGLVLSSGTPVQSDVRRLADRNMPELQRLEGLQRELGTGGQIRVAVTGEDVASPVALKWMADVEKRILALDKGLAPGPNLATIIGTGGSGVPEAAAIPRILRLIPPEFVRGILTTDRRRAELSFGIPLGSAGEQARLIGRMQEVLDGAPAGLTAQVAGLQALSASSVDGLQRERPWLLLLCALIIFVLLLAARRDVRRAAIPLVPALFAAGATAVLVEVSGVELSPLSAGLDPLVLAVGVEFGLLLEARYREERVNGLSPDAAARRAVELLTTPLIVAAGTVALGFLVLVLSRLPVLQQFGLVAALELALSVLASLALVPALAVASERTAHAGQASPPGPAPVVTHDPVREPVA